MINPPTRVIGIDLSLSSTGLAEIYPDGRVWTIAYGSKGKATDDLATRADRIHGLAEEITAGIIGDPGYSAQVLLEAPTYQGGGGHAWDRGGLWWEVVQVLRRRNVPVHLASPSTVKKWATGSGRAEKNTVGVHIGRLYPDVEITTDDEADALVMAHMLAHHVGYDVPRRAHHIDANLTAVKWADQ